MQRYVAVSMRSGRIVYVAPWSLWAPQMVSSLVPAPRISAPAARRNPIRSVISGSRAAPCSVTVPFISAQARSRFSVAPTLGIDRKISPSRRSRHAACKIPFSKRNLAPSFASDFTCRSIGRSPNGHPPGSASSAFPHLARSAPRNRIDERIFPASRFSTRNRDSPEGSMQSVLPSRRVLQPRLSRIASAVRTSSMSGQLCNTHGEVHRQHAARTGSTLFFAPCIRTVPERRAPPVIRSFFILIPPHSG